VLVAWIILAVALVPLFGALEDVTDKGAGATLPRGAESTAVLTELDKYRSADDTLPAVIVYSRTDGITETDRTKVESDRALYAKFVAKGEQVSPTLSSDDKKALMVVVPLPEVDGAVDQAVTDIRDGVRAGAPPGLDITIGGPGGLLTDYHRAFLNLDVALMITTGSIVIVLLLLIYRSPFLWLFPMLSLGFATVLTQGSAYLLAKHAGLPVDPASSSILMILLFGVGTDYALLLIARYREELHKEENRHTAMWTALRRSGGAIFASAATVVVGLACLALADMGTSRSLGLVGALGVFCGFLAMITVLPALLVIAGRWVFWPLVPKVGRQIKENVGVWAKIGTFVERRPRIVWVGSLLVIGALALGALDMKIGIPQNEVFNTKPEAVVAQETLAKHFPSGASDPVIVLADSGAVAKVKQAVGTVAGARVTGEEAQGSTGSRVSMDVVLDSAPGSDETEKSIDALRTAVHAVPGANALVGGTSAQTMDSERASSRDLRVVVPVVLAVILLFLMLLLRSLIAPVMLLATVAVSYAAALGASNLLFVHAFGHAGVAMPLPLVSFVFLAALGVDYNIFLMTRVREEAAHLGHSAGVRRGLTATGSVITSAGIVLAATFATFTSMPVVDMVQFGVVVGVGVLLDTFLVRTLLVPALALHIGRASWWPGALYRKLGSMPAADRIAAPRKAQSKAKVG
jgi:RND superfamily putative drug exporter